MYSAFCARLASPALALATLLAAGSIGCRPPAEPPTELPPLFAPGAVEADSRVLCGPSQDWHVDDDGAWSFRGIAEIACVVRQPPGAGVSGELVLRLVPDPATAGFEFALSWDGERLDADVDTRNDTEPGERPALSVWIASERAGPGIHSLEIERIPKPADASLRRNTFTSLELGTEGRPPSPLLPAAAERFAYLADLLLLGGAGIGPQKAGGVLFAGPRELRITLPEGSGRELAAWPENLSPEPAVFTIEVGGQERSLEVAPRARARLRLEVPDGAHVARLGVEGHPGGLFLWGAPWLSTPRAPSRGTPVVLVTLDTTRRDALGVYGAPPGTTPNLDRFAERATVYDDAWTTAPWTLPAHASMLTGRWPTRHGAGVSRRRLPADIPVLSEILRNRGWSTAGFAGGELVAHRFGIGRGFDLYRDPEGFEEEAGALTEHVRQHLDGSAGAQPFLFVNYFDPHYRYAAPPRVQERFGVPTLVDALDPSWAAAARGDRAAWTRALDGEMPSTPESLAWLRAAYLAEVAWMDEQLGRLFAELEREGLFDRAVVAVVADHGELLGEGGYLSHAYRLDPELVRVPLLVKWPGQRDGRRVAELVSVVDLFPTLLAAAGIEPPPSDGIPLPPGDDDRGPARRRRHVYAEEHVSRVHPLSSPHRFVAPDLYAIQGRGARQVLWKGGHDCARIRPDGSWRPVPCRGDGEQILEALVRRLGRLPASEARGAGEIDDELRAELEALGYL